MELVQRYRENSLGPAIGNEVGTTLEFSATG